MVEEHQVRQLELLHRAALTFNASLDLNEIFHSVLEELRHALRATGWAVWVLDDQRRELICQQAAGPGSDHLVGYTIPADMPWLAPVIREGRSIYTPDAESEQLIDGRVSRQRGAPMRSLVCAPLTSLEPNGEVTTVGVVVVTSDASEAFSKDDRALVDALVASASGAIRNARLYRQARQEIDVRRRAEQALRESEGHYRTLVETSPDAVILVDLRGHIQMCNRRTLQLFGYAHLSDLLDRSYLALFPPEGRARAIQGFENVLQGTTLQDAETTLLRGDGSLFEGEIAAALAADNNGEPASIVGFARDITERKDAETAIRRHNEELRILNDIAMRITKTQNLEQLLRAALDKALAALEVDTGWVVLFGPSELVTKEIRDQVRIYHGLLADPSLRTRWIPLLREIEGHVRRSRQPDVRQAAELFEQYAGMTASSPVVGVPLTIGDDVVGAMGVVGLSGRHPRNIHGRQVQLLSAIGHQVSTAVENARLSAEAADVELLRELDRMRSELIANFSHDLRTPLGLIEMSISTLLRDDIMLSEDIEQDLLQDVITQTRRLSHLVEGILDLGRLADGHLRLNRVLLDLEELVKRVNAEMRKRYADHTFKSDLPKASLIALADPDRMEQVLYNLLDNAAKYSPGGGKIRVEARLEGDHICLSVIDEGIGIPDDQLRFIFERFYRVDDPATEGISGIGLGLPSCRGIVEAHGGEIWAESTYGSGSTFTFTVPVAPRLD